MLGLTVSMLIQGDHLKEGWYVPWAAESGGMRFKYLLFPKYVILYQRAFLSLSLLICRIGRRAPWAWCGCTDSVTTHLHLAHHRCPVSALVPLPRRQDGVGGLSRVLLEEQEEKVQAAMREVTELGTAGGSPTEVGRGLPRVGKDVTNKEDRDPRGRVSLGKPRR